MDTGTVKWFNNELGFGFITSDFEAQDVYIGINILKKAGITKLRRGQRVKFCTISNSLNKQVSYIELVI